MAIEMIARLAMIPSLQGAARSGSLISAALGIWYTIGVAGYALGEPIGDRRIWLAAFVVACTGVTLSLSGRLARGLLGEPVGDWGATLLWLLLFSPALYALFRYSRASQAPGPDPGGHRSWKN